MVITMITRDITEFSSWLGNIEFSRAQALHRKENKRNTDLEKKRVESTEVCFVDIFHGEDAHSHTLSSFPNM